MSVDSELQPVQATRVARNPGWTDAREALPPAGPPVAIASLQAGDELVVEGDVHRILIPGVGSGEPGRLWIRDDTATLRIATPGVRWNRSVRIGSLVRAGGLVVEDGRGLVMVDPWVAPVG